MIKKYDKSGKTVLITGASSGIGASFARFLACEKGMYVLLAARREDRLKNISSQITCHNGDVEFYPADLSIEKERLDIFKKINEKHKVDILINNAGFGWYGYYNKMPWEIASQMLAINIRAVAHLVSLFLPGMVREKSGHIINIGSIAGIFPNQGVALYSATKAFLDSFTTALYRELKGSGVNISVMRLGAVKTEFFEKAKNLENSGSIPAEKLGISVEKLNRSLWGLIRRPRRVIYAPALLWFAGFLEPLMGSILDKLGPLLLKKQKGIQNEKKKGTSCLV